MKVSYLIILIAVILSFPLMIAQGLNIASPKNNGTYNSNIVNFSLSADNKSFFYYSSLNGSGRWTKMCSKLDKVCEKNIRVNEGWNEFFIKATDFSGNLDISTVGFSVDSKKPIIHKTTPPNKIVTNGSLFSVIYSEENLEKVTLFYGDKHMQNTSSCISGIKKMCNFSVDLSSYNSKLIEYWFNISDKLNSATSKKIRVRVDTEAPKIFQFFNTTEGNKAKFIFEIKEENFDEISYKDSNDCGLRHQPSKVLCSNLQEGRCVVTKTFCKGEHELNITVRDKAGNENTTIRTKFFLY